MSSSFKSLLSQPKSAAVIAGVIAMIAKWMDHKISGTKGTFVGYLKASIYSAGLVGAWVYTIGSGDVSGRASFGANDFVRRPPPFSGGAY